MFDSNKWKRVKFILDRVWVLWDECERIVRWLWEGWGFWDDSEMVEMIVRWLWDDWMIMVWCRDKVRFFRDGLIRIDILVDCC